MPENDLARVRLYLGSQNDQLYIVAGSPPAPDNDYPNHDADREAFAKVFGDTPVSDARGRRLVACWNSCLGLSDDALSGGWTAEGISTYAKQLEQQRDELLSACQSAVALSDRRLEELRNQFVAEHPGADRDQVKRTPECQAIYEQSARAIANATAGAVA